ARRIIRARRELAVRPVPPDELRAVHRTSLALNRHGRRRDRAGLLADAAYVLAFGVARAAEELSEAAALDDHRRAAVLAGLVGRDGLALAPLHVSLERLDVARELLVEL